ncbi:hypothetical protein RGQ13_00800 [Thalassotalea psychrophila]|uniref:EF-hand domain-containing protein n=1 Tax=Thalassotalea psychrophila TaxID=3065647 RepID=A0ABY9TYL6_9GAMM|nr:hypothetical protein RGQ13_00800 [Colwelliaceae bacterium SQ149]
MIIEQVFVIGTGRCGTTTFKQACTHIKNFTCAHESRVNQLGEERLNYPKFHIECDNRLSWFLGRLENQFDQNKVLYIHLLRDEHQVSESYKKRFINGLIMPAYTSGIYIDLPKHIEPFKLAIAKDYVKTVKHNINSFLKDKPNQMTIDINNPKQSFIQFWQKVDANGDQKLALQELAKRFNYSGSWQKRTEENNLLIRMFHKVRRIIIKFPGFLRNA